MIKPHHWSQLEFLSSRGQETQCLSQLSNNLSSWGLIWDLQHKVRTLGALASLLSQYTHFLLYFTNSMVCLCVRLLKRDICVNQGLCSNLWFWGDLIQLMAETLLGDYTDQLMSRCTQCLLWGTARDGLNSPFSVKLSGLFDHFITSWESELLI